MRELAHLARGFFRSLRATRPAPGEQLLVAATLSPSLARLFWSQPVPDLAHALRCARAVAAIAPRRADLIAAALLHDVGKRHSGLGTLGRSVATVLSILRLPMGKSFRSYVDHGKIGAAELRAFEVDRIVWEFAGHHHEPAPAGIDQGDWELLSSADNE